MKYSELVLKDNGIPNLMRIIEDVTKRMKTFSRQGNGLGDVK